MVYKTPFVHNTRLGGASTSTLERDMADVPEMSRTNIMKLVSALQMYHLELEAQLVENSRIREELLESREKFSELYNSSAVGQGTLDGKNNIIDANRTLSEMLGVTPQEIVNRPFTSFIEPDDQDIFYLHQRSARNSKQRNSCELRLLTAGGETLWVHMDSVSIETKDENDPLLRTAMSDITAHKQEQDESSHRAQRLQRAEKQDSLGLLAGGVAHNFNNLLCGIIGQTDLALSKIDSNLPAHHHLQYVEKTAMRAAELSKQMLIFSQGGVSSKEVIDIRKLLRKVTYQSTNVFSDRKSLEIDFADNVPEFEGDAENIVLAISNLVTNAIEAIGDCSGVVTISAQKRYCDRAFLDGVTEILPTNQDTTPTEGVYACFRVTDTGCGMDKKTVEKIFDPFFSTKFTGRGLGLAAVYGIVTSHRGVIEIDSTPGTGTTIGVMFPTLPAKHPAKHREVFKDHIEAQRGSVLIVADEPVLRTTAEMLFRKAGYRIVTMADYNEAKKLLREGVFRFDAMLLDLKATALDGPQDVPDLSDNQNRIPVILSSDYSPEIMSSKVSKRGYFGCLQKPYGYRQIVEMMSKIQDSKKGASSIAKSLS